MSNLPDPSTPLSYQSVEHRGMTTLLQAAWITLLVVGALTALGGLCAGGSMTFFVLMQGSFLPSPSGSPSTMPAGALKVLVITAIIMTCLPLSVGIMQVVCSLKIRRFSFAAMITAMVTLGLEILAMFGFVALGTIAVLMDPREMAPAILGLAFYVVIGLVFAAVEFLLIKALRDLRARRPDA